MEKYGLVVTRQSCTAWETESIVLLELHMVPGGDGRYQGDHFAQYTIV